MQPVRFFTIDGDDLADVMEFLLNILGKWRDLGDKVGVRQGKLDEIAEDNRRARDCMKKVILEWLHGNGNVDAFPPTRQGLMDALRSPLVEESGVADEIKQRIIEKIHKDIN